jgi:hypothetical protein
VTPWLRKNWIGLVAVVVLLPATLGITFWQQWVGYFASRPSAPIEVVGADTAHYGGTAWSLESVERISSTSAEGKEIGLPSGTDLVVATLNVEPEEFDDEGKSFGCTVHLQELDGDTELLSIGDALLDPIDYSFPDDVEWGCNSEVTDPYLAQTIFIVPSGAGTDGTRLGLSVSVVTELPDYLRFTL